MLSLTHSKLRRGVLTPFDLRSFQQEHYSRVKYAGSVGGGSPGNIW